MSSKVAYFKILYQSKVVLVTTVLCALMYYILIEYVISLNANNGFAFVTIPTFLIYLLVISSAVLLTLSLHSLRLRLSRLEEGSLSFASLATTIFGGVVAGCNCEVPVLASLLYVFSFNAVTVSSVISFLGNYQIYFFLGFIALNLLAINYHLGKLSSSCVIKKGHIVRK